ncbi:hypothetical protein PRUPE_2G069200 [Prunus persica]|uniref:Histone-lysine N-methyltransferase n=1 Tax=Prunus persica TaxID=3760 RepID=A0A251QCB4_PRUPE|nr:hypothetical protein PRUPE_2G069200 [Prunus persica]
MEGGSSHNFVPPSAGFDKSRILDVKPLRSLMPVFPAASQAPPFPPSPMRIPTGPMAAPIRSYRAPAPSGALPHDFPEESNGERGSSLGGAEDDDGYFDAHLVNFVSVMSPFQVEDGNRELVNYVLVNFDALRRRICQIEDAKESKNGIIKRADLKAGNILMTKKVRTNMRRRIGVVPGVEIGDVFYFRMEMCAVGLHAPVTEKDPVALSIVSSGGYDDDTEDSDVLIYSGQGGNNNNKDKQVADQKLGRGNLALERSLNHGNEVRVIRGVRDEVNSTTKVYVYDGLYKVHESWTERGKSGCNIFKYKLVRVPGQPGAFAVWKTIRKWKDGFSSRAGLVLQDLTSGTESIPVSLVNEVDNEKALASFTYFPKLKYSKSFILMPPSFGCNCHNACLPGDMNCSCIQKNGGSFPYTGNGILVSRKQLLHECGPTCPCSPNCKNRVSQTGVKLRLEVFKTKDRGWGLWSWDSIRAGSFICEYAGEVIDEVKRNYDSFKWNYEPGLLEEETSNDINEDYNIPYRLIISAKNVGNVSRFINHSCSPNVFWQPVLYEHNNQSSLHIAFFAIRHIPPMTELAYDYGNSSSSEADNDKGPHRKNKCLCGLFPHGSSKCRGYFG